MKIYKKDIAIEQFEASIELFFQDKYSYPTHNIIMSLNVLLLDLCIKKWHKTILDNIKKEYHKKFINIQREISNFSKHSEKDQNDYIEVKWSDIREKNFFMLIDNYSLFSQLYPDYKSNYINIFYAYSLEKYPNLFNIEKEWIEIFNKLKWESNINLSKENIYNYCIKNEY